MELHLKLKQDITTALKTLFSFSKYSETVVFPKKIAQEYDLFCIIRKDGNSFFQEYLIL